jgi:phytoene/squalene synthetase
MTHDRKIAALDRLTAVLDGAEPVSGPEKAAVDLMASLAATGVSDIHARQILQAFRRDAENPRCRTWSDLLLYCRYSAVPVGRFLIDLHGEPEEAYPAADALCTALQVLNHLQDCGDDLTSLDRVYLPLEWLESEGAGLDDLRDDRVSPGLRRVLDRCLDRVDQLLAQAAALPGRLGRSRLRWEAAVITQIALRLARHLRREDPLARRIALPKWERLLCFALGMAQARRLP